MSSKRVTLEIAAFLDSEPAKALDFLPPEQLRKIVEAFLSIAYDDLGIEPRRLDGEHLHHAVAHLLPGRLARKDPLAEHVPAVLEAYLRHLSETAVVANAFELERSLEAAVPELLDNVRTGENVQHTRQPAQKPVVHKAKKLGRNDPCSCGSGKKYKNCHGKPG